MPRDWRGEILAVFIFYPQFLQALNDIIIRMNKRSGFLTLQIMILGTVAVILVSGFTLWAATMLRLSLRDELRTQAFQTAEAGIEYYRWHLAHSPQDYQDGTGHAGPYTHPYYDKDGNQIGQFILNITPPPVGSTVVTIKSTGNVVADSSIQKVLQVQLGIASLAQYAVAANENLRFGTGTEVFGPIMANGGIHFDGLAHNLVQSAVTTYVDPDVNKTEWGVYTALSPADPQPNTPESSRPDVFMAGRNFPVPAVDFAQVTQTLANIKALAIASGTYFGSSTVSGYDLALATSGFYSVYKVTALAPPPNGCTNTSNQSDWGTWSIQTETLFATGTIPQSGVMFFEDNLWVRGQINHKHATIAAARFPDNPSTRADISINSSTLYTNYDGTDSLSYIAQNNFNVGLFSEDVLRIDGAIIAQNGRVGRYFYSPPNLQSNAQKCGDTVNRQKITLYGSIISNLRYGFGFTDSTGYQEREIIYDSTLLYNPPPDFPLAANQYVPFSWDELK